MATDNEVAVVTLNSNACRSDFKKVTGRARLCCPFNYDHLCPSKSKIAHHANELALLRKRKSMVKRSGDNLARTEDGASYNKLLRPGGWPRDSSRRVFSAPDRNADRDSKSGSNGEEDACDEGEDSDTSDEHIVNYLNSGREKTIRRGQSVKFGRLGQSSGCLPLEYGSEDTGVSLAALEYLRRVREEADDAPLFSACHAEREDSSEADYKGYYEDGAYIVAPNHGPLLPREHIFESLISAPITPYEAYTAALLLRFYNLRQSIRDIQISSIEATTRAKPFYFKYSEGDDPGHQARRTFGQLLKGPVIMSRLAVSHRDVLLQILRIIQVDCLRRGSNLPSSLGPWIFATLAALDETTLGSDDIAMLRDFAKKSFWLRVDFEPKYERTLEDLGHEYGYLSDVTDQVRSNAAEVPVKRHNSASVHDDQVDDVRPVSCEPAHTLEKDSLSDLFVDEYVPNDLTKTTLDMVTTIIGEVFGQRDLLDSRLFLDWPEIEIAASDAGSAEMDIE